MKSRKQLQSQDKKREMPLPFSFNQIEFGDCNVLEKEEEEKFNLEIIHICPCTHTQRCKLTRIVVFSSIFSWDSKDQSITNCNLSAFLMRSLSTIQGKSC